MSSRAQQVGAKCPARGVEEHVHLGHPDLKVCHPEVPFLGAEGSLPPDHKENSPPQAAVHRHCHPNRSWGTQRAISVIALPRLSRADHPLQRKPYKQQSPGQGL